VVVSPTYHQLLQQYPSITRPNRAPGVAPHDTVHHIITTTWPPIAQKPRRLAPEKLVTAKKKFEQMLRLGLARPADSPWASPLHLAPKTGEEWRPCGYYRALNARTCPERYSVLHIQDCADAARIFSFLDRELGPRLQPDTGDQRTHSENGHNTVSTIRISVHDIRAPQR
jgi:cleavage and polyadenylation specificity factor subunit 1